MSYHSKLQGLPEEIKLNICSQLVFDGDDASEGRYSLAALRLSCKAFAFVPTEKIFQVVKILPSKESLHALHSIATHPAYSLRVQALECTTLYLPVFENYGSWFRRIINERQPHGTFHGSICPLLEKELLRFRSHIDQPSLRDHYHMFLGHLQNQTIFQQTKLSDLSAFFYVQLLRLPKFTKLELWAGIHWLTGEEGGYSNLLEREALFLDNDQMRSLPENVERLQALFMAFSSTSALTTLVIHDLSITSFSEQSFALDFAKYWGWSIESGDWSGAVTYQIFDTVEVLELESIDLHWEANDIGPTWDEFEEKNLAQFIIAFKSLKALVVSFVERTLGLGFVKTLSSNAHCRNLSTIHFINIRSSEEDFLRFLNAHETKLRTLVMIGIMLETGHWVPIFHVLCEHFMLRAVRLNMLYDLEARFYWQKGGGDHSEDRLYSRLVRSILRKDIDCPLPVLPETQDSIRAWMNLSDKSFGYGRHEVDKHALTQLQNDFDWGHFGPLSDTENDSDTT